MKEENRDALNKEIKKLLSLLEEPVEEEKPKSVEDKFKGEGKPIILNEPITDYITSKFDFKGDIFSKYKTSNKIKIGLDEKNYKKLSQLSKRIYDEESIKKYTTKKYIEESVFDWLTNKYIYGASDEPIEYIQSQIKEDVKDYTYYFLVNNIVIKNNFSLGKCFVFCAEKEFIEEEKIHTDIKDDEFDDLTKFLKDKITLKIEVEGVSERAKEKAISESRLMMNILKVFLIEDSMHYSKNLPRLAYHTHGNSFYHYLIRSEKDCFYHWETGISKTINSSIVPTHITNNKLDKANRTGMNKMISYCKNPPNNELGFLVIRSINSLGEALSTLNFYDRTVKLISLLESIFIRKNEGGGQTTIKQKIVPKLYSPELIVEGKRIINSHYKIRDKYLHHKEEVELNPEDFYNFQIFIQKLLLRIIHIQIENNFKTKNELLDFFEVK